MCMNATEMKISHPSQWPTKTINEACELVSRGTAPSYVEHSAVLVVGQRCVREVGFQSGEARFHDQRSVTRVLEVRKGDVLLNSTGTGTIGRSCIFNADGVYIVDGHVTLLRSTPGQLDGRWLNTLFQSPQGQIYLETQCYSGSTNQVELSRRNLLATSIPLPPLPEQCCIAEILDTIDEAIQKTEALISKLKAMKQGLLHDLLTRGLDKNGKLRDPQAHPEQFKDSPLGRIPKEWGINPLEKLAEVDRGKFTHRPRNDPRFYGGAYPFVQTGDIAEAEGDILKKYSQTLNNSGSVVSREFPENTIAITIAANIADTAILGRPMYFPDSIVGAIVRPPNNVRYIELCIRRAKRILNAHAPQSAQKNINLEDLRPLLIPTPTSEEQKRIGDMYDAHSNRVQSEEQYRDKLKLQKRGLMHDLLTGKVRVEV